MIIVNDQTTFIFTLNPLRIHCCTAEYIVARQMVMFSSEYIHVTQRTLMDVTRYLVGICTIYNT